MYSADELRTVSEKARDEQLSEQSTTDKQKANDYLKKLDDQMMEMAKKGSRDMVLPSGHELNAAYWSLSRDIRKLINRSLSDRGIDFDFATKITIAWDK